MKPPSSLVIRGRRWRVRLVPRSTLGGDLGECHYDHARLSVATRQSPFDTRDTLLHEALHAVLGAPEWVKSPAEEERYVLALATGLMSVLRDNPEFVRWLTEPITP